MTTEDRLMEVLIEAVKLREKVEGLTARNEQLKAEVNRQHETIQSLIKRNEL